MGKRDQINKADHVSKKTDLRVSDHAIARYAERVLGLDRDEVVDTLRKLIGPTVKYCASCRVPFRVGKEEYVGVVENRKLLTILFREPLAPVQKARGPRVREEEL